MELELQPSSAQLSSPQGQRQTCLQAILLVYFVVCLVIGFAALTALYLFQSVESQDSPQSFSELIRPGQIIPQLALQQLAGSSGEPLAAQAIQAGELETAQAIILFDTELSASSRTALYLKLTRRFIELNQLTRAKLVIQHGRSLAILDPQLHIDERTSLLLQSLEVLLSDENTDADSFDLARESAIQLKRIGEQTPDLLPAERGQIFDAIRPYTRQLDDALLFQELNELARNPFLKPDGELLPSRIGALSQPIIKPDPALAIAVANRQQAAAALINRIAHLGGGLANVHFDPANIAPEQQALVQTLLAEDQVRTLYYQTLLSGQQGEELSLNQQLGLLGEYRAWIAMKIRIALGGFGLSILPEWEDNANLIVDELARITAQTGAVLDTLVTGQPSPFEAATLRLEKLHWLALQIELGLYPGATLRALADEFQSVQLELRNQQFILAFPVQYEPTAKPPGFRIQLTGP